MKREELAAARRMKRLELAYNQRAEAYRDYITSTGSFVQEMVDWTPDLIDDGLHSPYYESVNPHLETGYRQYLAALGPARIVASAEVRDVLGQVHLCVLELMKHLRAEEDATIAVKKVWDRIDWLSRAMGQDLDDTEADSQ